MRWGFAYPMQKFQDWLTQQWVIFRGRKIDQGSFSWLMGPFGNLDNIGENFIHQFAAKEKLLVEKGAKARGLISSMSKLNLSAMEHADLSQEIIDFYENTAD